MGKCILETQVTGKPAWQRQHQTVGISRWRLPAMGARDVMKEGVAVQEEYPQNQRTSTHRKQNSAEPEDWPSLGGERPALQDGDQPDRLAHSRAHVPFTRTRDTRQHAPCSGPCHKPEQIKKKFEIPQSMFSDHNGIKLKNQLAER